MKGNSQQLGFGFEQIEADKATAHLPSDTRRDQRQIRSYPEASFVTGSGHEPFDGALSSRIPRVL
jgi:hypothetical protein